VISFVFEIKTKTSLFIQFDDDSILFCLETNCDCRHR